MNESEILSKLESIGADRVTVTGKGSPLQQYLQSLMDSFNKAIRTAIENKESVASSRLKSSITPREVRFSGSTVETGVEVNHYWKYVNYGVNGFAKNNNAPAWGSTGLTREEFLQSVSLWRQDIGMNLGHWVDDNGMPLFKSYEQMDKTLMFLIAKNGQEGKFFLEDVINDSYINEITKDLSLILEKTIEFKIDI